MLTLEQIADLDRRGVREEAMLQLVYLDVLGRISARHEIWPFGKGYRERKAKRKQVSEDLALLRATPVMTTPMTLADTPAGLSANVVYTEARRLLN